ncbi:MAG: DNA (cytosine-5-)-methyltransferase [Nitrospira sp.]|nr:DNA (cytosine-5-)-methyltransferase [Nitrospira sp.]MDE0485679.1 DNA (cytosine-5-)-methyltransferase [Nitrospira sp.]
MLAAEFFAGMGLMRAGLQHCGIETVFANDIDSNKAALYRENWGNSELVVRDIRSLSGDDIPTVNLATASFPCVDLSLAGNRAGLHGSTRSSVIFDFCRILKEMRYRAPSTILIENVPGFLTANRGKDFEKVNGYLQRLDYQVAYGCVNASAFLPQSRNRVFILGSREAMPVLIEPPSPRDDLCLATVAKKDDGEWWPPSRLGAFLSSLSPAQADRVKTYQRCDRIRYFGAYRRTRDGRAVWEVRADEKAGALRTTRGGSARQAILRAGQGKLSVRWMNVGEYARLQGADEFRFNSVSVQQALFALGDAVCVPVIEWIGCNWLKRILL